MPALNRQLIMWEVPHLGSNVFIQMYVNPQNIQIQSIKDITETRTKGGYFIQYWGEKFDEIQISGHTGASGIEGINTLKEVYRSEQLALLNIIKNSGAQGTKRRQSLAQLAASVVMHYAGVQYFGYFKNFQFTESADQIGIYTYQMGFTVTKTIGLRKNWAGWHRVPRSSTENPTPITQDEFALSNQPALLSRTVNFSTSKTAAPADGGVTAAKQAQQQVSAATRAPGSDTFA